MGDVSDTAAVWLRKCGVALSGMTADDLMSPVPVGVALGLFVGKQAGIFGLSLLAVSLAWQNGLKKVPGCRFTAYRSCAE